MYISYMHIYKARLLQQAKYRIEPLDAEQRWADRIPRHLLLCMYIHICIYECTYIYIYTYKYMLCIVCIAYIHTYIMYYIIYIYIYEYVEYIYRHMYEHIKTVKSSYRRSTGSSRWTPSSAGRTASRATCS